MAKQGHERGVVHALVRIRRDGLIRAMRPGGDAPTGPDAPLHRVADELGLHRCGRSGKA